MISGEREEGRATIACALSGALSVLPVFLIGSLAVFMRTDLGFSEAGVGGAVSVYFGSFALLSTLGGRLSERLGPRRSMLVAGAASCAALLGTAVVARSFLDVLIFQAVAGAGNALAQPAGNLTLARAIRPSRLGLAFGVKQAAIPSATLFAGVTIPLLAVTLSWRWSFAVASLVAGPLVWSMYPGIARRPFHLKAESLPFPQPRRANTDFVPDLRNTPQASNPMLLLLATAFWLGSASTITLGTFTVESAAHYGWTPTAAGLLLAAASVVAIATQLASGRLADFIGGNSLALVGSLLVLGSAGFVLIGLGHASAVMVVGVVIAFGAGWGWNGLLSLAIVLLSRASPAAATGIVMTGAGLGGLTGPVTFGVLITRTGYPTAWLTSAVAAMCAGLLVLFASRRMAAR